MRPPLTWVNGNLLFGCDERDVWALYELDGVSYPHLAVRQQLELLGRLAALLYRLEADFQLLRVCRPVTRVDHERVARAAADARHVRAELFARQLECDLGRLSSRPQHAPQVFLAVSLRAAVPGLPGLAEVGETVTRGARRALGIDRRPAISERRLTELRISERRCRERLEAYVDCQQASTDQVQWLVRRALVRGLGDPPVDHLHRPQALCLLDDDGQAVWQPACVDVMRWHDALVHHQPRGLVVHSDQGESHQAQLVLGALPDELRFPGEAELLFWPLERLDFAVDACLHAGWVPNRDAVSLARKRRADAENFLHEESAGHGAPSAEAVERPYAAQELEHVLTRPDRPPLYRCDIVLSVGGRTEAELEERVDRLRTEYAPIAVHRPTGDQHRLLLSTLPAQRAPLAEYTAHLLSDQVAALMPVAIDQAGSELGLLCGHTLSASRRPVRLDLAEACQRSRAPTILLLGTLGSGKTVALQTLAYRAWVSGSGPVVDIDPKGDHRLDALPGVIADGPDRNLEIVELSGDGEHRGLLDPLRIGEPGEREDLAYAFLSSVLPAPLPAPWQTELRLAVQTAAQADSGSCAAVLNALRCGPEPAQECARALAIHASAGLAQLGFADPDAPPPEVAGAELVSLRIRHLRLPAPGKPRADCDEQERLGCALLRLLAAYALRLTSTDPGRHSVVCVDEAWALLEHAPEVIARLSRLGRSQNVTPLIASQRIGDVDALDGLVGSALVFGLDSDTEAQRALALLRQDPDDEQLRRRLLAFRAGRCLFLDCDGRLTAMQFEVTDPQLLDALDTTPRAIDTELAGAAAS